MYLRWVHRTVRWLAKMIRNVTEGTIHSPILKHYTTTCLEGPEPIQEISPTKHSLRPYVPTTETGQLNEIFSLFSSVPPGNFRDATLN